MWMKKFVRLLGKNYFKDEVWLRYSHMSKIDPNSHHCPKRLFTFIKIILVMCFFIFLFTVPFLGDDCPISSIHIIVLPFWLIRNLVIAMDVSSSFVNLTHQLIFFSYKKMFGILKFLAEFDR